MSERTTFTPSEIAQRFGVGRKKIMDWIRSGELIAIDLSTNPGISRPRYGIPLESIEAFEKRRAVGPSPMRRRNRKRYDGPRYFRN